MVVGDSVVGDVIIGDIVLEDVVVSLTVVTTILVSGIELVGLMADDLGVVATNPGVKVLLVRWVTSSVVIMAGSVCCVPLSKVGYVAGELFSKSFVVLTSGSPDPIVVNGFVIVTFWVVPVSGSTDTLAVETIGVNIPLEIVENVVYVSITSLGGVYATVVISGVLSTTPELSGVMGILVVRV